MDINRLRSVYPEFCYQSYTHHLEADDIVVHFEYRVNTEHFRSFLRFHQIPQDSVYRKKPAVFDSFIFHIGMVELLSYWKAYLSPTIQVECKRVTQAQQEFFEELLMKGMGEFFYRNAIDAWSKPVATIAGTGTSEASLFSESLPTRYLVPIGGGKDSALTAALLREHHKEFGVLLLNPHQAAEAVARESGKPVVRLTRVLDPLLLEKNSQGHPNGHTPFSAYIAFASVCAAAIYGYNTVLLSNERSAEEATVISQGQSVNHQYSKTFAFESLFCSYLSANLTTQIRYFSLLRPLYELQIAQKFSHSPQFHFMIRSCNRGSNTNVWCGTCPKCVSTYILFFPFLKEKTAAIFGKDLFSDPSLFERVQELVDPQQIRPFECVGTREESIVALAMAGNVYREKKQQLPPLLQRVQEVYLEKEQRLDERILAVLTAWNNEHFVPQELIPLLSL